MIDASMAAGSEAEETMAVVKPCHAHASYPAFCLRSAGDASDVRAAVTAIGLERGSAGGVLTEVAFPSARLVIRQGEPAVSVFGIVDGALRIRGRAEDGCDRIVGFLYPGDYLGLAQDDLYLYSAETIIPTRLYAVPGGNLKSFLSRKPKLRAYLEIQASNELTQAQDQVRILARQAALERVAAFLLMISRATARRGQSANPIRLPMSRSDIADCLRLDLEAVNRDFTHLVSRGVVRPRGPTQLDLFDIETLRGLAGDV